MQDIFEHNRKLWNKQVEDQVRWSIAVSPEEIVAARAGELNLILTPTKKIPHHWLPATLAGKKILCVASGGGQQVPLLAAAGAEVTSFDLSDLQLEQDRKVAEREKLNITLVQGNMSERWPFAGDSFDVIFNPCSLSFIPDVKPVWREANRVLKSQGHLMSGMTNPISYIFDFELKNRAILTAKYPLPFSDIGSLTEEERRRFIGDHAPLEFSHTLTDFLQGQMQAGFALLDFYEDDWGGKDPQDKYFPGFFATLAVKR